MQAIETIQTWIQGPEKMAVLGGLAGTGKTTVVSYLIEWFEKNDFDVIVACPTGKAAAVLRKKGTTAYTIHSIAYMFMGKRGRHLEFEFQGVPSEILVVDEASMIDRRTHDELMSSEARILYVGDYGQLPPVKEDPGIMHNMTAKLVNVHRQGDDLLDFAHAVRASEYWDFTTPNVVRLQRGTEEAVQAMRDSDVVICRTNNTRHRANLDLFFHHMEVTDPALQEKLMDAWFSQDMVNFFVPFIGRTINVMCVKNNPATNLWNGTLGGFTINEVDPFHIDGTFDDAGDQFDVHASLDGWGTNPGQVDWDHNDKRVGLDLGYAITAHKSQGSEWEKVCVLDETYPGFKDRDRWRYTAATRASKHLVWIPWRR